MSQPALIPSFENFPMGKIFTGHHISYAFEGSGYLYLWGRGYDKPKRADKCRQDGIRNIFCSGEESYVLTVAKTLYLFDITNLTINYQHLLASNVTGSVAIGPHQFAYITLGDLNICPLSHVACLKNEILFTTIDGTLYSRNDSNNVQIKKFTVPIHSLQGNYETLSLSIGIILKYYYFF